MKIEFKHKSFKLDKEKNRELYFNFQTFVNSKKNFFKEVKKINEIEIPKEGTHNEYLLTRKNDAANVILHVAEKINYFGLIYIFGNRFVDNEKLLAFEKIKVIAPQRANLENCENSLIRNHAKIFILNDLVILSSANVSPNNSDIEQYILIRNKKFSDELKNEIENKLYSNKINLSLNHKIEFPKKKGTLFFSLVNRGYSPREVFEKYIKKNNPKNIKIATFGITKKDIYFFNKYNVFYILSSTIKYFNKEIYMKLYKYENKKYIRHHYKRLDVDNYIIHSSNNVSTKDNLDFMLIEKNRIKWQEVTGIYVPKTAGNSKKEIKLPRSGRKTRL